MCALGDFTYDGDEAIAGGMLPLIAGLSSAKITMQYIERFSQPTDFGTAYRARLTAAPNIQVMLNSTCVGITLSDSLQRVDHIVIARDGQPRQRIHARAFVLATGGLEVPRLLLASRGQQNCGVGNRSKLVGRHYMCHLAAVTGSFLPAPGQAVARGYQRSADGVYCRRRFSVKAAAQAEAGIGNAIARLHQPRLSDPAHRCGPMSAIYLARHLLPFEYSTRLAEGNHRARFWPHAGNVARDPINTMLFGLNYLTQRRFARRKLPSLVLDPAAGPLTFDVHAEQLPNPASRITLGEQVDRFGMPVLKVDWRYLPADIATVRGTLALIGQSLSEGGHGSASFDMDALEADLLRERAYGGHHLGTARMSDSPRTGVVDRACRVHGLTNLYIASGAVFPTSGQANPTLTIVALALRLSDHLKRILASEHTAVASRLLAAGRAVSAAA